MHINHCASWVFHITLLKELILILLAFIFGIFSPIVQRYIVIIIFLNIKGIARAGIT